MAVKYRRNKEIVFSNIEGEIAILNVSSGKYFGLNDIGSDIWGVLKQPKILDEIVQELQLIYEVDLSQCHSDIKNYIQELKDAGLIEEHIE